MEEYARKRLKESAWTMVHMADFGDGANVREILNIADAIVKTYRKKGKVVLFGNGGSAAQAQHIAAEFSVRYEMDRPSLEAIALTADTSALTAAANDFGYDYVFEKQVEGLVKKKDIVIGLTTSGNSRNVLKGLSKAKEIGATTVALTGIDGLYNKPVLYEPIRKIREKNTADYIIHVPSDRTSVIQEVHIAIGHLLCDLVEKKLFGRRK